MNGFFKTLLISLLMLALPLQAAVQAAACQPSHGAVQPAHAGLAAQLAESGHHGHTDSHHFDSDAAAAPMTAASIMAGQHAGCSACAAFCAGVLALPAQQAQLLAGNGSERVSMAPAALIPEHLRSVLDRPPASS